MPTVADLGIKVKTKYPGAYDDLPDAEVGTRVQKKYPGAYDDFTPIQQGYNPGAEELAKQGLTASAPSPLPRTLPREPFRPLTGRLAESYQRGGTDFGLGPVVEGVTSAMEAVPRIFTGKPSAAEQLARQQAPEIPIEPTNYPRVRAASQVAGGLMKAGSTMIPGAMVSHPVQTAAALGAGELATQGTEHAMAGADPALREAAGLGAGLVAGSFAAGAAEGGMRGARAYRTPEAASTRAFNRGEPRPISPTEAPPVDYPDMGRIAREAELREAFARPEYPESAAAAPALRQQLLARGAEYVPPRPPPESARLQDLGQQAQQYTRGFSNTMQRMGPPPEIPAEAPPPAQPPAPRPQLGPPPPIPEQGPNLAERTYDEMMANTDPMRRAVQTGQQQPETMGQPLMQELAVREMAGRPELAPAPEIPAYPPASPGHTAPESGGFMGGPRPRMPAPPTIPDEGIIEQRARPAEPAPAEVQPRATGESAPVREPPPPVGPRPLAPEEGGGHEHDILIPDRSTPIRAQYVVRELSEAKPSHNPFSFEPNPEYGLVNERNYRDPVNAARVAEASNPGRFNPAYLITDNPDATNGPPIIDPVGNVLGGNNRTMVLNRAYANPETAARYKQALTEKAAQFGVDPSTVQAMRQPALLRQILDSDVEGQKLVRELNKVGTAKLTGAERAVSESTAVRPETVQFIGDRLANAGEDSTLAQVLEGRSGVDIVNKLVEDGVFTNQERPGLFTTQGALTPEAKSRISQLMLGRFFGSPEEFNYAQPSIKNKLERVAAPLARLEGTEGWDLTPTVKEALAVLEAARARGITKVSDLAAQGSMFGQQEFSPEAIALADKIKTESPLALAKTFNQYVQEAEFAGQPTLMGFDPPTREQAFEAAFGSAPVAPPKPQGPITKLLLDTSGQLRLGGQARQPQTPGEVHAYEMAAQQDAARAAASYPLGERARAGWAKFKSTMVDSTSAFMDAMRDAEDAMNLPRGGMDLKPSDRMEHAVDRSLRARTLASEFLFKNGYPDLVRSIDDPTLVNQYLIAKQASDAAAHGFETGRDLVADAQMVREFNNKPATAAGETYRQIGDKVQALNNQMLDYAVDAGVLSQEKADYWRQIYPDYVPLERVFPEEFFERTAKGGRAVASLGQENVFKRLKGSERPVENPLESLYLKANRLFREGERNKAGKLLAESRNMPGMDILIREPAQGENVTGKPTISYLEDGKPKTFITTPEIEAGAKSLDVESLNWIVRSANMATRLLKAGTTGINLPFTLANVAGDITGTAVTSRFRTTADLQTLAKAFRAAVMHDATYREMHSEAAGFTGFEPYRMPEAAEMTHAEAARGIEKFRSWRSPAERATYVAHHPFESFGDLWRTVEDFVGRSEEFGRARIYTSAKEAALKAGLSEADARIRAANESNFALPNYLRFGTLGRSINSLIPYFNARVQGVRSLTRSFETDPQATTMRLGFYALLPTASITAWNLSDPKRAEAYRDIQEYEKENNFVIVPPNPQKDKQGRWDVWKVKVPPDIGQLMTPARRGLEQMAGQKPMAFWNDMVAPLLDAFAPVQVQKPLASMPQAFRPWAQAEANYDYFRQTPRVPDSLKNREPSAQAYDWTSGTARKVAQVMNRVGGPDWSKSPIQVEEFVKDVAGGLGEGALRASDQALAAAGAIPKSQIGGRGLGESVGSRFLKARGGAIEAQKIGKIKSAQQQENTVKDTINGQAQQIWSDIADLEPSERRSHVEDLLEKRLASAKTEDQRAVVERETELLVKAINRMASRSQENFSRSERYLRGVTDPDSKARFLWQEIKPLAPQERRKLIEGLHDKKLVSQSVIDLINVQAARDRVAAAQAVP